MIFFVSPEMTISATTHVARREKRCAWMGGRKTSNMLTAPNLNVLKDVTSPTATVTNPTSAHVMRVGKVLSAKNVKDTRDVFTDYVRGLSPVNVRMVGEVCFAIRISTTAPTIGLARTERPATTLERSCTHAAVR